MSQPRGDQGMRCPGPLELPVEEALELVASVNRTDDRGPLVHKFRKPRRVLVCVPDIARELNVLQGRHRYGADNDFERARCTRDEYLERGSLLTEKLNLNTDMNANERFLLRIIIIRSCNHVAHALGSSRVLVTKLSDVFV